MVPSFTLELSKEGQHASELIRTERADAFARRLVSDSILAQVLLALWDSGFYEYVRHRPRFDSEAAALDLGYQPEVFDSLIEYLVGHRVLQRATGSLELTPHGISLTNIFNRGLLTIYLGGYNPLLTRLGPLLRGEMAIDDPSCQRSAVHAAGGTAYANATLVFPELISRLRQRGARGVLDLGCGSGEFLLETLRTLSDVRGIGLDQSSDVLHAAREQARRNGLEDRLSLVEGTFGDGRLAVSGSENVDTITMLFMLHELGRGGRRAIVTALRQLVGQFPGCALLIVEMLPPELEPPSLDADADHRHTLLDYALLHPLSGQGAPLAPVEWIQILEEAGCHEVDSKPLGRAACLYAATT